MSDSSGRRPDFPAISAEILAHWQAHDLFARSVARPAPERIFYDGPPFPTGTPHHGSIFVSILKDSLARYLTMAGYRVPRRWGWDCHGLPIENAVEKRLGLASKSAIEATIGVAGFNAECRAFVSQCDDAWRTYIDKIGRWVDYDRPYRTMDADYMESTLWVFATCYEKGLIYKDFRVTPYCWHCETSLSLSDTRESDATRPRQDPEAVVRFALVEQVAGHDAEILAWTTTPWTLPANLALAVGPDFVYAAVLKDARVILVAEASLPRLKKELGASPEIVARFAGHELQGLAYVPLFPYFEDRAADGCFRVLTADFVTLDDGVGVVHIAPGFGEDDYWLAKRHNLGVVCPVDASGRYTDEVTEFARRNVHAANGDVLRHLRSQGKVLRQGTIEHNYPHCWRCREPLIYRAMDAWYFAVEKLKPRLLELNEEITWVPASVKAGRFGKWLENARDWNLSRSRYWGTPLPIWECAAGHRQVLGSRAAIEAASGTRVDDLHKEVLDSVTFPCPQCAAPMARVPEVLDCWFESGAMPYGQCHYPFENRAWFDAHFPADFVVEYPGQIRCWFYYLHVLGVALFDKPAFRHAVVHGTLLAEDGTKLSKSKQNYTDPMELIDRYGADALRLYLIDSPAATMLDLEFRDAGVEEQIKALLLPLWNAFTFFSTYAAADGFSGDPSRVPQPRDAHDQWILAELAACEQEVARGYASYQLNHTVKPVVELVERLTNWYIRRGRTRFWAENREEALSADKTSAYETLFFVLVTTTKLLAPAAPFVADKLFRELTGKESVHLEAWPDLPAEFRRPGITHEVALVRKVTTLGLALRKKAGLRVRQPLNGIKVVLPRGAEAVKAHAGLIRSELNVREVVFLDEPGSLARLRAVPNARALGPRFGRDLQRIIVAARAGQVREEADGVVVFAGETSWKLAREDIEIGYEALGDAEVASEGGIVVALDETVSPELFEEGIANDVSRAIQALRRRAGFRLSDRIDLYLNGPLAAEHRARLASATLSRFVDMASGEADAEATTELEGRTFVIRVRKPPE